MAIKKINENYLNDIKNIYKGEEMVSEKNLLLIY